MAIETQYTCDYCGEIVGGVNKTAEVKGWYFQIKGGLLVEFWDKKEDRRRFFYATRSPRDILTFCSGDCLMDFLKEKQKQFEKNGMANSRDNSYLFSDEDGGGYAPRES